MTDVTEYGDAVENILLPATSSSMTSLAVDQKPVEGHTALNFPIRGSLTAVRC